MVTPPPGAFLLHLTREASYQGATLGKLFIDGVWQWWTLEDEIRPASEPKVPGQTAIPAGCYQVVLSMSARFRCLLPEILNVPHFTGIRIHPGNTTADTAGCVLIGGGQVKTGSGPTLIHSRVAVDRVIADLTVPIRAGRPVWIEIVDPPMRGSALNA